MSQILIIVIFIAAMYFMMIRPQQKQAKQRQQMLAQIQKGTKVVTIGGLHGVVDSLDEKIVVLDVEGVYLTFDRSAIRTVVPTETTPVVTSAAAEATEPVVEEVVEDKDVNVK